MNMWEFDPAKDNIYTFLDSVHDAWWAAEWGFKLTGQRVLKLQLHTGGHSENEYIISQLEQSLFWTLYWVKSERGGHYYFIIKKM